MPDIQGTIAAIKTAVNNKSMPQPKHYKKWVEASDRISFHAKGVRPIFRKTNNKGFLLNAIGEQIGKGGAIVTPASYEPKYQYLIDDYILNRHPNESVDYYNWRLSTFPIVAQEIYLNAKQQILGAIFQSSQYCLESLDEAVDTYLDSIDFENWVTNVLPELVFTDPYGLCAVIESHLTPFPATEKAEPIVKWVDSHCIKQYKKDVYLLFEDEPTQDRRILIYLDANYCIKFLETLEKDKFDVLTWYEHGLNKLPVIENGKEFFQPFVIWADLICRNVSDDESIAKQASYPVKEVIAPKCTTCFGQCTIPDPNNPLTGKVACSECGGRGIMSINPGDTFYTPEKEKNDQSQPQDKIKFYNPDIQINEFSLKRWQVFRDLGMKAMHMKFVEDAQSGTAKAYDRDQLYILISNITVKLFEIAEFALRGISAYYTLAPFADVENYTVDKPQQFQIKSEYDIQKEYTELLTASADLMVRRSKLDEYYSKIYYGNPMQQKKYSVIKNWDWLFGMNDSELNTRLLLKTAETIDYIRHDRAENLINNLIDQKGEDWFIKTESSSIIVELEKLLTPLVPKPSTTTEVLPTEAVRVTT